MQSGHAAVFLYWAALVHQSTVGTAFRSLSKQHAHAGKRDSPGQTEEVTARFEADLDNMEHLLGKVSDVADGIHVQLQGNSSLQGPKIQDRQGIVTNISFGATPRATSITAMPMRIVTPVTQPHNFLNTASNASQLGPLDASQMLNALKGQAESKSCSSASLKGFVEDIEAIVDNEIRPKIEAQHAAAQEILDLAAQGFEGCETSKESLNSEIAGLTNNISVTRAAHLACRTTESSACQTKTTCETTVQTMASAASNKCSWAFLCTGSLWPQSSAWPCDSMDPPPVADVADQCHPVGSEEYGMRLRRTKEWFDEKVVEFMQRETDCKEATETYETKKTECETTVSQSGDHQATCDHKQEEFELAICAQKQAKRQQCTTYAACLNAAMASYTVQKAGIQQQEAGWKAEWITVLKVQCYLKEFKVSGCIADPAKIAQCDSEATETAHLDLVYPQEPSQPENCNWGPGVCSQAFRDEEYDSLPPCTEPAECMKCALPEGPVAVSSTTVTTTGSTNAGTAQYQLQGAYGACRSESGAYNSLGSGDGASLESCLKSCDNTAGCHAVSYQPGQCYLEKENTQVTTEQSWQCWEKPQVGYVQQGPFGACRSEADTYNSLGSGDGSSLQACLGSCDTTSGCHAVSYQPGACYLDTDNKQQTGEQNWQCWEKSGADGFCARPAGWCAHSDSNYMELDCDGDGIEDPFCKDILGQTGFRGSANNCLDTWPQGQCKTCTVMLFEHDNYQGWHQIFPPGSYNLIGNSDNQVTSVKVGHHCQVTLYEGGNEQGWSVVLAPGDYTKQRLEEKGFHNDQVSSIKVGSVP